MAVAAVVDTDERPPRGAGNGGSPRGGKHRGPLHGGGMGIGWRPAIAGTVADLPGLRFCEVIAESLGWGRAPVALPRGVAELRERGVAVVPHGVRLSLGGAEPLDPVRVTRLAACAVALDAPLVSEHVAFVRAGGREAGHLLPLPRSRAALDVLTSHVRSVQAELDVPLALEPIAALFDWPDDEYTEGEFLTALLERTGAMLLLDVANVYANAVNRGTDPEALFDAIPLERMAYVHVAGGAEHAADRASTTTRTPTPSRRRAHVAGTPVRTARRRTRGDARTRRPLPARRGAARRAGRDRVGGRPPPRHRHMTRELRVSARRVARPGTASCADAPGESRDAARTAMSTAPPSTSPPARPSWSPRSSRAVPCRPASTPTGSPWPAARCCARERAKRRRCGRCWPHRSDGPGPTPSPPPSPAARLSVPCATAGTWHGS